MRKKPLSCYDCYYYSHGNCMWFNKFNSYTNGKPIPKSILNKGCKLYTAKIVRYLIEKFDGEFI